MMRRLRKSLRRSTKRIRMRFTAVLRITTAQRMPQKSMIRHLPSSTINRMMKMPTRATRTTTSRSLRTLALKKPKTGFTLSTSGARAMEPSWTSQF